jgi:hypothetical protein
MKVAALRWADHQPKEFYRIYKIQISELINSLYVQARETNPLKYKKKISLVTVDINAKIMYVSI